MGRGFSWGYQCSSWGLWLYEKPLHGTLNWGDHTVCESQLSKVIKQMNKPREAEPSFCRSRTQREPVLCPWLSERQEYVLILPSCFLKAGSHGTDGQWRGAGIRATVRGSARGRLAPSAPPRKVASEPN